MKIGRIAIRGHPRQKIRQPHFSTDKLDVVAHDYNPSYGGSLTRSITIQAGLGKTKPNK
jgi:hypothetical protein